MKKIFTSTLLALTLYCSALFAQNEVNVPANEINALLNAVTNAAAGDVFVLENGGYYFNQGTINVNVPITIKASDPSGVKPLVQQAPKEDGSFGGEDLKLFANTTLENLRFNGIRTSRTNATGRAIRLGAENIKMVVDGCVFERYWLRTIGLNDQNGSVIIYKNNIHLWDGREDRIDNGRFIDCRSAGVDSLIVVNNTFLNCNDRIIRHMGGDLKPIKYALFDHNTFYGNIGYRPPFQFRLIENLVFTNNIISNVGLLGTDTVSNRIDEIDYAEPKAICIFTVTGTDSVDAKITMTNNNVYTEKRFTDLFTLNPDTVQAAPLFNKQFEDRIDVASAVMEEDLSFVKAPSLDSLVAELENYIKGGTAWSNTGFITRTEVLSYDVLDMSYGTSAKSYSSAIDGFPLGDLNWYPEMKKLWEEGGTVDVKEIGGIIPQSFALEQNYPNPFNPTTNIKFSIPKASNVQLNVFNALGQQVATLVNQYQSAGNYEVNFDASNLSSGLYIYQIKADNFISSKKMMLIK